MRKLFTIILVLAGAATASAQSPGKVNVGFEYGLPVGDTKQSSSYAIGGSLKYEQNAGKDFFITFSAGYTYFPFKDSYREALQYLSPPGVEIRKGVGFVPVKIGAKQYVSGTGFFGEAQIGASISTNGGGTGFAYAPGIGYTLFNGLELGARYEGWSKDGTVQQIGFRLGYRF